MAETWEDTTKEGEEHLREWTVEYTVNISGEQHHHLTVLWGEDHEAVQRHLLAELKRTYSGSERIDVTVLRMESIKTEVDALFFEGCFTP
tara:strand:- start:1045 stop:1314 length:270 start_codon:yes stop_codon:yes gene_type:complete